MMSADKIPLTLNSAGFFAIFKGPGGVWGPIIASAAIIVGIFIGWLLLAGSRKTAPQDPTEEKLTTFACGEDVKVKRTRMSDIEVEETRPHSGRFFSPIRQVFRGFYEYIRPSHAGDLRTYLLWVAFGIVLIMLIIGIRMW